MHVNNTPVSNYMVVSWLTCYIRLVDSLGTVVVTLKTSCNARCKSAHRQEFSGDKYLRADNLEAM